MAKHETQVVVAGHICLDIIPTFESGQASDLGSLLRPGKLVNVGRATISTGGAVSNTGLALHRLGLATALMGKVGDDVFGRAILDLVRQQSAELADGMSVEPGEQSSYTVVLSPPGIDRSFLHCPGANDTFGRDDVNYDLLGGSPRLFHFGYPPLMRRCYADGGREFAAILKRVKGIGLTVSLDMARPDPDSPAGRADWPAFLANVLPLVDVFLPSLDEILFMLDRPLFDRLSDQTGGEVTRAADVNLLDDIAGRLIAMGPPIVALKLGDQGLYLRVSDDAARLAGIGRCRPADPAAWAGKRMLGPCFEVNVVGTTGSGDCTIAGFLAGLLKGLSPEQTVCSAVAVGACNVEAADAVSGVHPWDQVQARLGAGWARRSVQIDLGGWQWDQEAGVYSPQ
jgi:sugar/nucleoside kinase (ribokinase family)